SSEETISEDFIVETTCATFHTNIVNKAVEKYHDIFKKQSKGLNIQLHDDLQTIHETCVKHANLYFKQAKKLPGYAQKYEEKLKEELEQILKKKLEETFKCRKDFVDNCFKKASENFQTSLENLTDFGSKEIKKLKEEITLEFLGNFLSEDEDNFEMADSLQTAFADTFETFLKQKSIREKELIEQPMREMKQKLIQQYKTRMAEMLENTPTCDSATFHKFHTHILNTIMETFTQAAVGNNFDTAVQPGIEDSSQRLYDEMIENISAILEEFEEAQKYIEVETNAYSNVIMQPCGDQDSLTFHQNEVSSILGKFEENCKFPVDSKEREYFKLKLETSLEEVYYSNKAKNWIHEGLKEYQQQMKRSANSCRSSTDFQKAHEKVKKTIFDSFRKTLQDNCSEHFCREQEKQLGIELESAFEEMEDIFKMKMNADQVSAEELKEETRKFYHNAMRKHVKPRTYMNPVDLQDLHKTTVEAAIEQSKAKPALKKMLENWLQSSFQKYKDENDMVLNYEDGVEPAIGIDLGTTYCCVAVLINGKVEIVRNLQGQNTTPSYVRIDKQSNEQVVGFVAKESSHRYAENTIFDAKRMIGRRFEDEKLQNDMNYWPFSVVQGEEGPAIEVAGNQYPPEQIASFLLRQLVTDAEKFLGKTVTKVVITVPAYFTDGQRQATIDAGEMAGLQVLTILNEPTAASIAYKMERFHEDARNVLIFDLGGGTFDVAILKTDAGSIEILAVDGDTHLGGEDFDKAMMQYCAEKFQNEHKLNPFNGKDSTLKVERDKAKQRLRRLQTYCEKRKIDLSFARSTTISVDTFQGATDLEVTISRETFEELVAPYFTKALQIVERVLKAAKLSKESIEDVVLVGGSTRIPRIQEMLTQFFNGKALNHTINPDEAVAYGAAVKAALMNGNQAKKMFNFKSIQDATPMSLGVEAFVHGVAGHFSAIIPKSSKIPTVVKQKYSTLLDNQDSVLIKIYQGEAHLAKDNEFLGEFILKGIPPAPAGKEMVEVSMHINDMGILHVRAICKSSRGSELLTVFENKGRLSQGTKVRLLKEAQANDPGVLRRSYRRFLSEKGTENHGGFYKPKTVRKSMR
ncbi:Heat shock 70 kDa protein cognate 4, partial [Orchesella cincta]